MHIAQSFVYGNSGTHFIEWLDSHVFVLPVYNILTRWRALSSTVADFVRHFIIFNKSKLRNTSCLKIINELKSATPSIKLLGRSMQTFTNPWGYPGYTVKVFSCLPPSPPPPSLQPFSFSPYCTGKTQPHSATPTDSAGLLHASSTTLRPFLTRPKGTTGLFLGPSRTMIQNCAAVSTLGLPRTTWEEGVIRGQVMRGWLGSRWWKVTRGRAIRVWLGSRWQGTNDQARDGSVAIGGS